MIIRAYVSLYMVAGGGWLVGNDLLVVVAALTATWQQVFHCAGALMTWRPPTPHISDHPWVWRKAQRVTRPHRGCEGGRTLIQYITR